MDKIDDRSVDPIEKILHLIRHFSSLANWGFEESFQSATATDKQVIYDSEWCRVKFVWGGWDALSGNTISIYYGRLHAPNQRPTLNWNGEECHAWHRFEHALHFLDRRSPIEAATMNYLTPLTRKFFEGELKQKYHRRQPEWLMTMHMEVWEHYGKSFFELFDLRHPDLWEQYRNFLKEFYDIKGRVSFINPPMDKVC